MKRVLIYHNIMWSHYKARIFSDLSKLSMERSISVFVVQYAMTERRRLATGSIDLSIHQYPHRLMFEGSYEDLGVYARVRIGLEELSRRDPDVVVLPGYWDISHWVLLAASRIQRRKVILSFDSSELDHRRSWFKELLKRIFVSNCDGGFTYGNRSKRYLLKLGMPEGKITVRCQAAANDDVRRIFDSTRPARRQLIQEYGLRERNFCYVGRLSTEKNVSLLIRAFASLVRACAEAKKWGLLIAGDGPERQSLTDLCESEGVRNVRFIGGVSWREVPRLLSACDVLVLPSTSEPWGLVINEAMICGLPVLVSDACGCVEDLVFAGETGFRFNPTRPDDLQRHMEYLVRFPAEIDRIGAKANKYIEAFTPRAAAVQMLQGIERLLGHNEAATSGKVASRV